MNAADKKARSACQAQEQHDSNVRALGIFFAWMHAIGTIVNACRKLQACSFA